MPVIELILEVEAEGLQVLGQPRQYSRTVSQNKKNPTTTKRQELILFYFIFLGIDFIAFLSRILTDSKVDCCRLSTRAHMCNPGPVLTKPKPKLIALNTILDLSAPFR